MKHTLRRIASWIQSSRVTREDGSALVEFSLSACLLMVLEVSLVGLCMVLYSYSFVSDAAREATRYAMVRGLTLGTDCSAPGYATCIAQNDDIQAYVKELRLPGVDPDRLSVSTNWLTSTGADCGTQDSCKAPGNLVHVNVAYSYPLSIPLFPPKTLTMHSQSEVVIVQ